METLDEILDEAKKACGATSDSDLARKIGVSQPTLSNYRSRRTTPDAFSLMQLQKILKKDARELLAIIEGERAKDEERRKYWHDIKSSFRNTTAAALVTISLFVGIGTEKSEASTSLTISMYIM